MRFILFLLVVGALTLSAGAAYFFFGKSVQDPLVAELFKFKKQVEAVLPDAEAGGVKAQFALAELLRTANPAFRDDAKAATWYRKAAEQGHIEAQFKLGTLHAAGAGVSQNFHRASEWFQLAAGLGKHAGAQYALGTLYFHGRGVPHSYGQAVNWFRRAAAQKHPGAQYILGLIHKKGWGVDEDPVEAFKWLTLALDDVAAVKAEDPKFDPVGEREELLLILNRSQRERADRLIKEWRRK